MQSGCQHWSGSGESSSLGLKTATFLLCAHMVFSLVQACVERETENKLFGIL